MLSEISETLYAGEQKDEAALFVIAPVLCKYVLWVLSEAINSGKKRLYFLARDGYSMYKVACEICSKLNLPIECRYLYCSRYALRGAEYWLLKEKSMDYICLGGMNVTFAKVMSRAGLSDAEATEVAKQLGYADRMTETMSYSEVIALAPILVSCPIFMDLMLTHSKEKYPLVCEYLKQEGMLEDIPYAIVDSGWVGSMQKSLQHILVSMGYQGTLEGYYFGMYEYPKDVDAGTYHVWYFGPKEELRRKVYFNNNLFECIFSSPESMAIGYEWVEGQYCPVFEKEENPNKEKVEHITAYLEKYARLLVERYDGHKLKADADFTDIAARLLKNLMGRPTRLEAKVYGDYVFCDDVIGEKSERLATRLTYEEIKENRLINKFANVFLKKGKHVRESAWPEASVMLVEKAGKRELAHCALYKYVLYLRKQMK